jgi:hypothetical protein
MLKMKKNKTVHDSVFLSSFQKARHVWLPRPDGNPQRFFFRTEDFRHHSQCIITPHYAEDAKTLIGGFNFTSTVLEESDEFESRDREEQFQRNNVCKDMLSRYYWLQYAIGAVLT